MGTGVRFKGSRSSFSSLLVKLAGCRSRMIASVLTDIRLSMASAQRLFVPNRYLLAYRGRQVYPFDTRTYFRTSGLVNMSTAHAHRPSNGAQKYFAKLRMVIRMNSFPKARLRPGR